jgi:translation initiation factor IF-2
MAPTRKIEDFLGKNVTEASFSSPVRIVGFNQIPPTGSVFHFSETKKEAEALIKEYKKSAKSQKNNIGIDENSSATVIPLIVKADVLGTLEAIENLILELNNKKDIYFKIISSGAGSISETDIKMAVAAKNPIIIGFHTKVEPAALELADRSGIEIKIFDIIYKITEWLEEEMEKRRPRVSTEEVTGRAKVIRVFSKTKDKQVFGAKVKEGTLQLKSGVKIIRRDVELGLGKILELQQQKVSAQEIKEGNEFGSMIESKVEIAPGDIIEAFIVIEK